jgi:hypothetical protein
VTESVEQTINAGQAPQWVTVHTPVVQLDPGSYWVAIHSGGTAGIIRDYGGDGANNWYGNSDAYSDGASSSFGGGSAGSGTMSVGFGYTPGVYEIRKHGRTTVGTIASSGLTADYARAQPNPAYVEMPTGGPITGYYAYLDGNGGASGTQQMRIAMYLDDCYHGEPARYWSESEVVSIPAGQPAGWVYFPVKMPNEVGAVCNWTLALESGGTQGVVRDYADGTNNWYGIQDTFSDGPTYDYPTNPATPGVATGTGRLSMYFEYAVPAGSP